MAIVLGSATLSSFAQFLSKLQNLAKTNPTQEFNKFLKATINALPGNASADVKTLAAQFYDKLPAVDLEGFDPREAARIVLSAYEFMGTRKKDAPKIRITPAKTHTTIEILNNKARVNMSRLCDNRRMAGGQILRCNVQVRKLNVFELDQDQEYKAT